MDQEIQDDGGAGPLVEPNALVSAAVDPAGEPTGAPVDPGPSAGAQWLVGIGSSAGGIEALRELLPNLVGGDVTYIIAQHMSPARPSLLLQVLARETSLDLREVEHGARVQPGVVYLVPPNCDVEVVAGRFVQQEAEPRISPQPSINVLLRSLAEEAGPRSVSVILSGTGSDGGDGSTAVRSAGGRTVAQDPDSARYRDMPLAAIDSGEVEFVLEPRDIGPLIGEIVQGRDPGRGDAPRAADPVMMALARHARQVTGWDMSAYKDGTLGRQLGRRISALGLTSVEEYERHVAEQPEELARLRDSMLINVTSFLRDQNSFEVLSASLRELVESAEDGRSIRAWVAGCATGEEAYTLAILLVEACRAAKVDRQIKVFATDISEAAMETARRGVYPLSGLEDMPAEWVDRYFRVEGSTAVVDKWLRDLLVIARHDITRDPPMVRMDLVSCRNLLIYLQPTVQERVLRNLHAALNGDGLLFLGRSEAIAEGKDLFSTISAANRIYRRRPGPALPTLSAPLTSMDSLRPRAVAQSSRTRRDRARDEARDRLLLDYGPAALVIDDAGTPVHKIGDVGRYLTFPEGEDDFSVLSMIDPELRTELKTLLSRLGRDGVADASHPTVLHREGEQPEGLLLRARKLPRGDGGADMVLLVFEARPQIPAATVRPPAAPAEPVPGAHGELVEGTKVASLEAQLAASQEHLQAVVEELESSNEELQAMNEELQASSEELQATNEELEATNEELQATNEELTTVNETLEVRSTELLESNEILRNIQESVHTAVVLLDRMQRVTQYSPLAVKVFGLVPDDVGSPLARHNSHLDVPDLEALIDDVMVTGEGQILETRAGHDWYILQVLPFQISRRTAGAILALSDITDLVRAREDADEQRLLAEGIFAHGGTPMAWLTAAGEIESANTPLAELLGVPPSALAGRSLVDVVTPDHAAGLADLLGELGERSTGRREASVYIAAATDEVIPADITMAVVQAPQSGIRRILATVHETSAAVHAQEVIAGQGRDLDAVFWGTGVPMALLDGTGRVRRPNRALASLLGHPLADIVGRRLQQFALPEDRDADSSLFLELTSGGRDSYEVEQRFVTRAGETVWLRLIVNVTPRSRAAEVDAVIATLVDITQDRLREQSALELAQNDPLTGLVNRTVVFDRIAEAAKLTLRSDESLSVLFIDLNGFKAINDRFGHDGGDSVLKAVARRISEVARDVDTVARLGGDEFLVLARHQGSEQSEKGYRLAERIQAAIAEPIPASHGLDEAMTVTASIGIAHSPSDGIDADELVRKADVAMYSAKAAGGAEIAIYSNRHRDEHRRLAVLRSEILQSLQDGRFVAHYQPIVSVQDLSIASFEVLARWNHPERGIVSPADFLTDVKNFHQLDNFTIAMARQAAEALADFRRIAPEVMVSLNLDPSQLTSVDFRQRLLSAVGGDLAGWVLELSESDPMGGDPALADALRGMRDLGARISLDDFGTGYSNLAHLKSWGFDEVKIDRSLVKDAGRGEEDDTVLGMMVELAHAMGSVCVAEGVEDLDQVQVLRAVGADRMQGYAVLRPTDPEGARQWLASAVGHPDE